MIKVILHSNALSERADSTNAENLSYALNKYLKIESLIVYNKDFSINNQLRIKELKSKGFSIQSYKKPSELHQIGRSFGATHSYFYAGGEYSPLWIKDTFKLTHAMFNNFEPHGDKYNYISEWLFHKAIRTKFRRTPERKINEIQNLASSPYSLDSRIPIGWVPFIVNPKPGDGSSFRKKNGIPSEAIAIGRIGGFTEFSDPAAQLGVIELLDNYKDLFFIFVNTRVFHTHPRIKYIKYLSSAERWDFYAAGDVFINGRLMGESFGYSICEPLSIGKPIIAPNFHRNFRMDKHHISILNGQNLLYKTKNEFQRLVIQQVQTPNDKFKLSKLVEKFSPESSISLFADNFLDL